MYSIGQLVKAFGISRSTLLYYDKINLLTPSARTQANYRQYTQCDFDQLVQISTYKEAGLSLESIAEIINGIGHQASNILTRRLSSLNEEIGDLRKQQQIIVNLLGKDSLLRSTKVMNKAQWVDILKSSGMDEAAMRQWHIAFEKSLPQAHSDFLQSLGIEENEIEEIKKWSEINYLKNNAR